MTISATRSCGIVTSSTGWRLGVTEDVTLVVHDWGSALGFDWARRHPEASRHRLHGGRRPPLRRWQEWPEDARSIFQGLRSPAGEQMILDTTSSWSASCRLPSCGRFGATPRWTSTAARSPRRDDRLPTLIWPRQIPIGGEPADVAAVCAGYARGCPSTPGLPKLLVRADPGSILTEPSASSAGPGPTRPRLRSAVCISSRKTPDRRSGGPSPPGWASCPARACPGRRAVPRPRPERYRDRARCP